MLEIGCGDAEASRQLALKNPGIGVIAMGSKMIDAPVVKRALRTIRQAEQNGLLNPNWRESDEG